MKIAVYCSAKDIIPEEYLQLGDQLGAWLAREHHTLIYGGATGGLMSRTSNAFANENAILRQQPKHTRLGKVIGVVPKRIIEAGRLAQNCDKTYIVRTMNERKQKMKTLSDCFICLPGSYGTLDEMYDVIASGTVGEHSKPIFILNYKGFYNGLISEAQHMRGLRFLPEVEQYRPIFVNDLNELYELISNTTK